MFLVIVEDVAITTLRRAGYLVIRLTEEEIDELTEIWFNGPEELDWAVCLANAQLKKVVEWMEDVGYLMVNDESSPLLRGDFFLCKMDWQELLEEVK